MHHCIVSKNWTRCHMGKLLNLPMRQLQMLSMVEGRFSSGSRVLNSAKENSAKKQVFKV